MSPFFLTTSRTMEFCSQCTEVESKEKHSVWDPVSEMTDLSLCPIQSQLRHIYHGQLYARVDIIPKSGTLDLASGDLTIGTVITQPPVVSVEIFHVKTEDQNRRRFLFPAKKYCTVTA
jgi:hypothetical protein